jgi:hypothetical protein
MGLPRLSNLLWRERDLLELLLFKLEEEQLLLAAGKKRWIARARHEVGLVREEMAQTALARAIEVETVARGLSLPAGSCLRELAQTVPSPWGDVLGDHRDHLLALSREAEEMAGALAFCQARVETIDLDKSASGVKVTDLEQETAVGGPDRMIQPSLLDFLR